MRLMRRFQSVSKRSLRWQPLLRGGLLLPILVGLFVAVQTGNRATAVCSDPAAPYGTVFFDSVTVPAEADYRFWVRIQAPDTTNNAFLLNVGDAECNIKVGDNASMPANSWQWIDYGSRGGAAASSLIFHLTGGVHQLKLFGTEPNVKVDRILLLADVSCIPEDKGDNCVDVDSTDPTVSIASPTNNSTVTTNTLSVRINASDNVALDKVEYFLDGTLKHTFDVPPATSPFQTTTDISGLANGSSHTVKAKATDTSGNFKEVTSRFTKNVTQPVGTFLWNVESVGHSAGTALMEPGQTQNITIRARNTGTATWVKGVVKMATWTPGRKSPVMHGTTWLSDDRIAHLQEATVAPGAVGTFNFTVRGPYGGEFVERVNLVAEGITWFNDPRASFYIRVHDNYDWQLVWYSHSTGSINVPQNTTFTITLRVRNTGGTAWHRGGDFPMRLGTEEPKDRGSRLFHSSWLRDFRPARLVEEAVGPGAEGTFTFQARTPGYTVYLPERFNLVAENIRWLPDRALTIPVNVP